VWVNSVVKIVGELHIDALGLLPPSPTTFEIENIVFENGVQRRPALRENAHVLHSLANEMRIVVDVNPFRISLGIKSVKVKAFGFVLADVVTNHDVAIGLFHDAAKPVVIVTVVVLNERVDAVVVGIESAAINPALANISIRFIVLDFYAICPKAKNAVAGVIATAVGQNIVFVDGAPPTSTIRLLVMRRS